MTQPTDNMTEPKSLWAKFKDVLVKIMVTFLHHPLQSIFIIIASVMVNVVLCKYCGPLLFGGWLCYQVKTQKDYPPSQD